MRDIIFRGKRIDNGEWVEGSGLPFRSLSHTQPLYEITAQALKSARLTYDQILAYGNGKTLYGWHISNLEIYDKPKELSEFVRECHETPNCRNCNYHWRDGKYTRRCRCYEHKPIERPPQSYFYVEEGAGG